MKLLEDLDYNELTQAVSEGGFPRYRADQLNDMRLRHRDYSEANNLPKAVKEYFSERYLAQSVKILETVKGKDAEKYLFLLHDGNIVEGVFMPHNYGNTLCVSTQVGCRMGCVFCASGLNGLIRNLSAGEILGEVLAVNALKGGTPTERAIGNIVLMGSGEPLDNYDNVVKFLRMIIDPKGLNFGARNISLSTSGLADKIKKLADEKLGIVLSISLHAPTDEQRSALMPVNRSNPISELMAAADYYFKKSGRRIIFEYALTAQNSDDNSIKQLIKLLKGRCLHVNLINLNYVKERGMSGLSLKRVDQIVETLNAAGIGATLRRSMGNDIEGACGQLRNKYLSSTAAEDKA